MESFFDDITNSLKKRNTTYTLVIGDFNSKLGKNKKKYTMAIIAVKSKRCYVI